MCQPETLFDEVYSRGVCREVNIEDIPIKGEDDEKNDMDLSIYTNP